MNRLLLSACCWSAFCGGSTAVADGYVPYAAGATYGAEYGYDASGSDYDDFLEQHQAGATELVGAANTQLLHRPLMPQNRPQKGPMAGGPQMGPQPMEPQPNVRPAPRVPLLGFMGRPQSGGGLRVARVAKGSPAEEMGLEVGDTVLAVNGRKICCHSEYLEMLQRSRGSVVLTVKARRGNIYQTVMNFNTPSMPSI